MNRAAVPCCASSPVEPPFLEKDVDQQVPLEDGPQSEHRRGAEAGDVEQHLDVRTHGNTVEHVAYGRVTPQLRKIPP